MFQTKVSDLNETSVLHHRKRDWRQIYAKPILPTITGADSHEMSLKSFWQFGEDATG
jgi:hypothetical protein